ncbi:DUF6415 family natural product biosynthesis protein [Streptomyces murinus]|uniref:DUF6415 family natural product biosynthesis protein n=1 Tax=Streptomyces murinus TaxID=33900 RepID=UPI002E132840|nr:DUF6415 family natural product biosynthesis protein [Streptomyces murinus]
MNTPMKQDISALPVDIARMRQTVSLLLGPEDQPNALPPAPKDLDTLTLALRGHLELLIPEVGKEAERLPKDSVARYCASACIGEACGKLQTRPAPRADGEVEYARSLATRPAGAPRPLRGQRGPVVMKAIVSLFVFVAAVTTPALVLVLTRASH